ncbi:MAG: hypothetical protein C4B59_15420 [Candidatus Methanogaster sp.]|uniref:Uncharacterized protein n=1 Tax=Candidatus Methanogaster sp. TaxID=3386292 RepID=A0AC61KZB8_9EURY|nr:MAG: hypothetical protein C4B59_15420 [ANME-2 cluster archaeon]
MSGCVQELSEIGTPGAAPPAPTSEVAPSYISAPPIIANWNYVSYHNLSISNAPVLDQTARITYSIIPDRDIEILLVQLDIPDGFELMDVEGEWPQTWHNLSFSDVNDVRWFPTNLSKDKLYQFSATIKAVKTGNWTITGLDWEDRIYLSVSENSARIRAEPFPDPFRGYRINKSEFERMHANMLPDVRPTFPSDGQLIAPPETFPFVHWWNGTAWIEIEPPPKNMIGPYWNGTEWVGRKNQS